MFLLGESFSETDGVKAAVPFFSADLLNCRLFSFVAPQGRSQCPLSHVSVDGPVCQLVDFLTSSTQTGTTDAAPGLSVSQMLM